MSLHKPDKTKNTIKPLKVGLFGGSFDPIHMGHIHPTSHAASLLGLDSISLIPANISPLKDQKYSSNKHRSEMVKLVCQEFPLFHFDDRELVRGNASYTVDTLKEIATEYTRRGIPVSLYFFVGMDSLIDFTLWHKWQDILMLCHIVVSPRPGYTEQAIPNELTPYLIHSESNLTHDSNEHSGNIFIMPEMLTDISSTEVRSLITEQRPVKNKLTPKVHEYILQHKIY